MSLHYYLLPAACKGVAGAGRPSSLFAVATSSGRSLSLLSDIAHKRAYVALPVPYLHEPQSATLNFKKTNFLGLPAPFTKQSLSG